MDLSSSPPPAGIAGQENGNVAGRTSKSLKRAAPRFLGDDEAADDNNNNQQLRNLGRKPARNSAQDLDRLFEELEKDDVDIDALPPPLSKRAKAGNRNNDPDASQLLDDKITAHEGKKKGGKAGEDGKEGEGEEGKTRKKARKRALMNEERLMGDRGLKKLKESLKGFKIKGKGHEEEDLRRLMTVYQIWTHQMFPQGTFRDTLESVEKVCRSKAPQRQMRDWRDEARGIFKTVDPSSEAENHAGDADANEITVSAYPGGTGASGASSPSAQQGAQKKSYFDNIPTSSPGGALGGGDEEMADNIVPQKKKSYFDNLPTSSPGGALGGAGMDLDNSDEDDQELSRGAPTYKGGRKEDQENFLRSMVDSLDLPGSDDDIDDEDLFGLLGDQEAGTSASINKASGSQPAKKSTQVVSMEEEDDFGGFDFPDEEQMMQEMAAAAKKEQDRWESKKSAVSFYPNKGKQVAAAVAVVKPSVAVQKATQPVDEEENFDDFDFGTEEDILREMESAQARMEDSFKKSHGPPSLTTASSIPSNDDSRDLGDLQEDESFSKGPQEVRAATEDKCVPSQTSQLPGQVADDPFEEEDLYS